MKNSILILVAITTLLVLSCGKKDQGGPPPGCAPTTVASPYFGTCVARGQCPQGLVQNPSQVTMCADPMTGNNVQQQVCGPGYVLVAVYGCVQQGPCQPGQGLVNDTCRNAVSAGYAPQQQMYMNTGGSIYGGAGGWGSTYGGSPYGAYQNPYGWGMYPRY